jgi:hypothetical protein
MHRRNLNPHGQWPRSSPPRAAPLRCPKDFLLSSKRDIIRIQTPAPSPSNPFECSTLSPRWAQHPYHGALYVVGGSSCLLFPDPRKHNYQGWCGIAATQPFFMSFAPSARDSHRGVVSPIFQRAANHHVAMSAEFLGSSNIVALWASTPLTDRLPRLFAMGFGLVLSYQVIVFELSRPRAPSQGVLGHCRHRLIPPYSVVALCEPLIRNIPGFMPIRLCNGPHPYPLSIAHFF